MDPPAPKQAALRIARAFERLLETGLVSVLILDADLRVIDRQGGLAEAVPVGVPVDEALPYLAGLAPDLLDLQDDPGATFLLANVGLANRDGAVKVHVEAFWQASDHCYCLLLHRLGLRTEPETEIVKQIRSRRIAEQHLQETRRDLAAQQSLVEALGHSAPVALAIVDPTLTYRFATRAWHALFGLGVEPLEGQRLSEPAGVTAVFNPDSLATALAGQAIVDREADLVSGRAAGRRLLWNARPVLGAAGRVQALVIAAVDLSGFLESKESLSHRVSRLEAENRALDEFVATIAHDLEAPRRAIDRALVAPSASMVADIARHSDHMRGMLAGLLEHARATAAPASLEAIDLAAAAETALSATGRQADFQLSCQPAHPSLAVDRAPLETILRNLIANAVRHHDRGHGRIELGLQDLGTAWCLRIADDGPGIPEGDRQTIFEPFRRPATAAAREGAGLGLALVASATRRLGGVIRVGDRKDGGRGVEFTVEWPKVGRALV
jgi:signal transduction histidine kinase